MASVGSVQVRLAERGAGSFAIEGALGFATVPQLWVETQRLFGGDGERRVDLGAALPVDSAGLALLVAWQAGARARGITLRFENVPERLRALARISEVDGLVGF